ncbi:MAG: hypothetical protein KME23_03360 [Goleter apudmare HA4340-LM2]|jgi:hypothetical protein|nr:hypothetical protein [Goleter apudmare HA4340-LM2]
MRLRGIAKLSLVRLPSGNLGVHAVCAKYIRGGKVNVFESTILLPRWFCRDALRSPSVGNVVCMLSKDA